MRKTNLELFRIISMLSIIAHHYVVNSGLLAADGPIAHNPLSLHSLFLLLWGAWGKTGINCFVLFSGYFMCDRDITLRKFLKLLCELMFYRIIISSIFWIAGYERFTLSGLIKIMIPIKKIGNGFTSAYLVFFLFIPFLNIIIHNMTEKQHVRLLALVSFVYIFLGTFIPVFSVTMNYVTWFMVLFLISSYIRRYPKKLFENTKFWGVSTILCVTVSSLSVIVCTWLGAQQNKSLHYYAFVSDSNTLLAVLTGLSAFMFFKNLNIPQNRFINSIAATTFGVLCIHANSDTMRRWLWHDTLNNVGIYSSSLGYLHAIGSVMLVFIICSCIDLLRIKFIEKPFFTTLDKKLPAIENGYRRIENHFLDKFLNQ